MPTAFVASYGSGRPVISILGEFDALPGISQKAIPTKEALQKGGAGHGCGHNLVWSGQSGCCHCDQRIDGGGKNKRYGEVFRHTLVKRSIFGKIWMVREGFWNDVDVNISWHPGDQMEADVQSTLALIDFKVEFFGQAAHASADPWNGRSASDALELYTAGINYYREHVRPTVRMHYHIQDAGKVVNVVPDYSKLWVRIRDSKRTGMLPVYERAKEMAKGAAMMADVEYKISLISGIYEVLPNRAGGELMQNNLELLGPIHLFNDEEMEFGKKIQRATKKEPTGVDGQIRPLMDTREHPGGGSTDVGDVSWNVANINLTTTIAPRDIPWHSWAVVACAGMSIGHKGMIYASKAMAMTMFDLFNNPKKVAKVKEEFFQRKGNDIYQAIIPDGPPPVPKNESNKN